MKSPIRSLRNPFIWGAVLAVLVAALVAVQLRQAPVMPLQIAAKAPRAMMEPAAAVVGGRLFVMGGHTNPGLIALSDNYSYDPVADTWAKHAELPQKLSHINAVVENDENIWIAGGYEGNHPGRSVDTVWRYHVPTDTWHAGPPLPQPRATGGLALVDRHLYFYGGLDADRTTNHGDHWRLDLDALDAGAQWEPRAPMPGPRGHFGVAALDGKIYAIGGQLRHDSQKNAADPRHPEDVDWVHRYDPSTDTWEEVASLPKPRSHFDPSTFIHDGQIIIVGGRDNTRLFNAYSSLSQITAYDPETDSWAELPELSYGRYCPVARVIDGRFVVAIGGLETWREMTDETLVGKLVLE